ncbi:response regulator transcription factor [Marinobacterium mangrovicola]|uniref:DNA-binding NarL/FixJ family response regulator n=1 Tax=Marinobacterium mangrovicola TaxID=1476959 RepID=A0A4R1GH15_9GAMM|nr:response regulator transcription factor [Marinobacterium mangrovicola]TCK07388.1 DNA-binding NarL/FixJ family response regulator [Marinobacterium mangrovicola]
MDYFCVVSRDDIAERWGQALQRTLKRIDPDSVAGRSSMAGICLAHWDCLQQAGRERLLARAHDNKLLLLVLTDHPKTDQGRDVIRRGAKGYGNTFVTSSLLLEMVKVVKAGDIWAGPEVLQSVLRQLLEQVDPPTGSLVERFGLSDREAEVLAEVMAGVSNKVAARRLDITERTVKAHMSAILNKTGARDRVELILLAQRAEQNAV